MHETEFILDPGRDFIELNQLLKLCGLAGSGGEGKHLVATGAVQVDGAVELRKTCKIRAGQRVDAPGASIRVMPPVADG
jgi:ribosome-associated protein